MAYRGPDPKFESLTATESLSAGEVLVQTINTSNTASSTARVNVQVAGASADDPYQTFSVNGVETFAIGIDNSDSDKFKISDNATLGTNDRLTIDSTGLVTVPGSLTVSTTLTSSTTLNTATANLNGAVTINDSGADVDMRVEGSGDENLLFVDAGDNRIGVGTATPTAKLEIVTEASACEMRLQSDSGQQAAYYLNNTTDEWAMYMPASNSAWRLFNGVELFSVENDGRFINFANAGASGTEALALIKSATATTNNVFIDFFRSGSSLISATAEGDIRTNGSGNLAFQNASDKRLKTNIQELTSGYDTLKSLRSVTFDWIEADRPNEVKGFIAQEVEQVLPKSVSEREDGFKGLTESEMIPVLWSAVRTLISKVEELENAN